MGATSNVILILIAILLPPLSVFLQTGCSCDLLINFCLTLLGYIPGHIHAFWLIYKKAKAEEQYGIGNSTYQGNGTYVPSHTTTAPVVVGQPQSRYGTI